MNSFESILLGGTSARSAAMPREGGKLSGSCSFPLLSCAEKLGGAEMERICGISVITSIICFIVDNHGCAFGIAALTKGG